MQAKIGPKHGRVASAIGEAFVLDSILGPVSIPVKVGLAVKFVVWAIAVTRLKK
jgi:hypothetical protein